MKQFRYDMSGSWLKGNTHTHSTRSDGGKAPSELAALYAGAGYDFIFLTDHWVASQEQATGQAAERAAPRQASRRQPAGRAAPGPMERKLAGPQPAGGGSSLLVLDGIELDGKDAAGSYYHVVCLGRFSGLASGMPFVDALETARSQKGMLILAHPHWTGNTLEESVRHGFHGIEVYNAVCQWLNGKGHAGSHLDALLEQFPGTLCFASDDAHISGNHPGWNQAWVMVNARSRAEADISASLRSGNFYSTCGPRIDTLSLDDGTLRIECSPVRLIWLVGPRWRGARVSAPDGQTISGASFRLPSDYAYMRVEIEDELGRRAWTNPLLVEEG